MSVCKLKNSLTEKENYLQMEVKFNINAIWRIGLLAKNTNLWYMFQLSLCCTMEYNFLHF